MATARVWFYFNMEQRLKWFLQQVWRMNQRLVLIRAGYKCSSTDLAAIRTDYILKRKLGLGLQRTFI